MKKRAFYAAMLLLALLALLGGCAKAPQKQQVEIVPVPLSADQEQLLSLLGGRQEAALFTLKADTPPAGIHMWVEAYEKGVRGENTAEFQTYNDERSKDLFWDQMAVSLRQDAGIQWTLTSFNKGGRGSHTGASLPLPEGLGMGFGAAFTDPVTVREGEEVLLFAVLYTAPGQGYYARDIIEAGKNPKVLEKYEVAYLVKCRLGE